MLRAPLQQNAPNNYAKFLRSFNTAKNASAKEMKGISTSKLFLVLGG